MVSGSTWSILWSKTTMKTKARPKRSGGMSAPCWRGILGSGTGFRVEQPAPVPGDGLPLYPSFSCYIYLF
jgi:hypothetical protein